MYIHIRTYNEFFVIYIGSFDTPSYAIIGLSAVFDSLLVLPDSNNIKYTMEKAMYLIDESGLAQYNALKEKGFYGNIMGTSAVFSIFCDSIKFNKENMSFIYYGRQRIERRTSVLMRELVTEGFVKRVPRTENNPHGLLIVNWRTILNKDIDQKTKSNY